MENKTTAESKASIIITKENTEISIKNMPTIEVMRNLAAAIVRICRASGFSIEAFIAALKIEAMFSDHYE